MIGNWNRRKSALLAALVVVMVLASVSANAEPVAPTDGPTLKHTSFQDFLEGYGDGSLIPVDIGGGDGSLELARLATGPDAWTTLSQGLPLPLIAHAATTANGCLYVSGGMSTDGSVVADVYSTPINADGTLGPWNVLPDLPQAVMLHQMVAGNGYLFVVGGSNPATGGTKATVYSARLAANCGLGSWAEQTPLPSARERHQIASAGGDLFVVGGLNMDAGGTGSSTVYSAPIHADGTLGPWTETTSLPTPLLEHSMATATGCLFVAGGTGLFGPGYEPAVYSTLIQPDGTLGAWVQSSNSLPEGLGMLPLVATNGYLFAVGGVNDTSFPSASVYRALIAADCSVGSWTLAQPLPKGLDGLASVANGKYILALGSAWQEADPESVVYSGDLTPEALLMTQAGDRVTWGRYTHQFDLGADLDLDKLAWVGTFDPSATVSVRYRIAPASTAAFGPWSAFSTDNPVSIGQVGRYIQYEIKVENPGGNPGRIDEVVLNPSGNFVLVQDEDGQPVAGALIYRTGQLLTDGAGQPLRTGSDGRLALDDMQIGDTLVALALQHEQPSAKAYHDGWAYRVYLTSMDVDSNGSVTVHTVSQLGEQVLTVRRTNPLVLFNLLVSVEWNAYRFADAHPEIPYDTFLKQLARALRSASTFLYDVTDGQFAFGQVAIYDAGRHWADADLQILASDQVRPNAMVGGIAATHPYTYTSSAGKTSLFYPGHLRLGRAWNRFAGLVGDLDQPDAFRTLVHEFAHYALYLYDEYQYLTPEGELQPAHCTSDAIRSNLTDATNASIMDWHYNASELAMQGTQQWSAACQQTMQWQAHQESDWETVVGNYRDTQMPPRWLFTTPADLGGAPNPGPEFLPLNLPTVAINPGTIVERDKVALDVMGPGGVLLPTQQVQVYLFKQNNGDTTRIIDQGSPDSQGRIELLGLTNGDVLKAVSWDGSLFASQVFTSTAPLRLGPAAWNPAIEGRPVTNGGGLALTVSQTGEISGALQATLFEVGGTYSQTIALSPAGQDIYTGTFAFDPSRPVKEGHLWLQATSAQGHPLEAVTTYAIGGAPGSHERSYPPMDPSSSDGNLRLHIPDGAVPDDTLVIVMPTRGLPPVPEDLTVVGTPYNIGASGGITHTTQPAALTMFYSQEAVSGLDRRQLRIYYWNTETGQWESKGGVADEQGNFITTAVDRFGIYAIMAEAATVIQLYPGWNLFSYPVRESLPITQALASCAGKYQAVWTYDAADVNDPWKRYIVGDPPYANDLLVIEPRKGYWINMTAACALAVGGTGTSRLPEAASQTEPTRVVARAQASGSPPGIPAGFFGTAQSNGYNLPEGVRVSAWISGVQVAETYSFRFESQSVYSIDVPADDPSTPVVEGGSEGVAVTFKAGAGMADQTATWGRGATAATSLTAADACPLAGDVTCDCSVNAEDVQRSAARWLSRSDDPIYDAWYDLDRDGDIDIADIIHVVAAWGEQCQ